MQFGGTPLHAVSLNGCADVAEMLVDCGAVVDLPTEVKIEINGSWFYVSIFISGWRHCTSPGLPIWTF